MDARLEVGILGPLEVRYEGVPVELPGGRSRSLLVLLALQPGRLVPTARLIDELWGSSPPATVVTALHGLVSGVRKSLGSAWSGGEAAGVLVTRAPGYFLDIAADQVDAHRFRALVHRASIAASDERAALLREALASWRGPALADVEFAGPTAGEAIALEELRLVAYEERIDADLALGRHIDLPAEIELLVSAHPLRERLYGQLMLAHYRAGRQSDALEVWRRARAVLVEQVGVEPGPGLRRLQQAILEHDPALDPAAGDAPGDSTPDDARDLAARAGELLAAAGARVFDRHYDADTAEELFSRAELLLPEDHPQRDVVADRIPEFYLMLGRPGDADARLTRSLVEARERGDRRRESYLRLERARIQLITGPDPIPLREIEAVGVHALEVATEAGHDQVISQVTYLLGLIEWRRGRIRRMEQLFRRGLATAERSGSPRERLTARWLLAVALVEGPTPTDDAIIECEELAELETGEHAGVLTELARLHALRGEHDHAQDYIDQARGQLQRRPGMRRPAMFVAQRTAEVGLLAGRPDRAEPHLRAALALADELGEADQRAQLAARLAAVALARGHPDEAEELAHKSRHAAPTESVLAQVLWRTAMAAVRAGSNDPVNARRLAEEATTLIPDEMPLLTAEVRTLLPAPPLDAGGHPTPA